MVAVQKNTKLLPPRPNEIVGVKTNKLGEVTCVKYTNATPCISLDGICAASSQVKFVLPRETPKRSALSSLEREAKRPRTTIAMLEDRVESLKQALALVTSTICTMSRQTDMNMLEISNLKKENERLVREMARLAKKN
jgi:cell shape-determining protein MreC